MSASPAPRLTGNAPSDVSSHAMHTARRTSPAWRRSTSAAAPCSRDHERVQEAAVVGGDDHRPVARGCARARSAASGSRSGRTAGTRRGRSRTRSGWRRAPARADEGDRDPSHIGVPARLGVVTVERGWPGIDLHADACAEPPAARSQRAVWALQQPLDKRAFGSGYDDVELLGSAVTAATAGTRSGSRSTPATARCSAPSTPTSHPRCRCPPALRGPAAALSEHVALWPLGRRVGPRAPGSRRAAAADRQPGRVRAVDLAPPAVRVRARRARAPGQRRARSRPRPDPVAADYSANGHGSLRIRRRQSSQTDVTGGRVRALITGASGFAGGWLVSRLRRRPATRSRAVSRSGSVPADARSWRGGRPARSRGGRAGRAHAPTRRSSTTWRR